MSNTVLTAASNQWMNRPADQRFSSLTNLHAAVCEHRDNAVEAPNIDLKQLRIDMMDFEDATEPVLIGQTGKVARFTHNGFRQLASRIGAPANYLRELPGKLVMDNMNYGLQNLDTVGRDDNLLFSRNGDMRLRAALSSSYRRIWNADITKRLLALTEQQPEWQPAPAAFDGSRGLYASDNDMFAFLVDNERRIFEKGPAGGLGRGFFVSNSETGNGSFVITTFFYEYVCGNHRVWGASGVKELRVRHVGNADDRAFNELSVELTKYADASAKDDEDKVQKARTKVLAANKDELLDLIFGLRLPNVTRRVLDQSYAIAESHEDWYGNPHTAWGITGGMTQVARDLPNASDRVALERATGRVLQMAF
jgi:hypothetical protein